MAEMCDSLEEPILSACLLRHAVSAAVFDTDTRSVSKSSMNWQISNPFPPSRPSSSPRIVHQRALRDAQFEIPIQSSSRSTYLLIENPNLHTRIPPVFFENTAQRPSLQLPITPHHRSCPVSPHVAAYQHWEGLRLQQKRQGVNDQRLGGRRERWEV